MAFLTIKNIKIAGMSIGLPSKTVVNDQMRSTEYDAEAFIEKIGVKQRRLTHTLTTSDLCYDAAEKLISDLGWDKKEIEALFFVSQTPDYLLPATSCIMQDRLGLSRECYAMDISLGCSGWTYGLSAIASLMSSGSIKKGLLLVGDSKRLTNCAADAKKFGIPDPLFGHAGTVTALEYIEGCDDMNFHFGTDGSGYDAIIIPGGGARHPFDEQTLKMKIDEDGVSRCALQSIMKGMDVFAFGISAAPKSVKKLLERIGKTTDQINYFVFHQANKMMNQQINKKLGLTVEKAPSCMYEFGNTSSASIPVTIVTQLADTLHKGKNDVIACGFGVGLSWCTAHFVMDHPVISELVELDEREPNV